MIKTVLYTILAFLVTVIAGLIWFQYLGLNEQIETQKELAQDILEETLYYSYIIEEIDSEDADAELSQIVVSVVGSGDAKSEITASTLIMEYDPDRLVILSVENGDLFSLYPEQDIDNVNGKVVISGVGDEVAESNDLAFLTFQKLVEGSVEISIVGQKDGLITSEEEFTDSSRLVDAELDYFYPLSVTYAVE